MPVVGPSGTTSDKGHQVFQPVQVTSNQSSPTPGVLSKQASPERSFEPESESEVVPEAVSALHASQLLSELTPEPVVEREAEPVIAPVPLVPLSEPAVPSAAVADEPLAYPAGSTLENTSTPSAFPSVTAAPVGTSDLASPSGIPPSEEAVATSILSALTTEPELTVPAPASSDAPSLPPLNLATSTLTPESGLTSPFDRETAVPFLQPRGRSLPPAEDDDEKKTAGTP